jgi:hypothetical protein
MTKRTHKRQVRKKKERSHLAHEKSSPVEGDMLVGVGRGQIDTADIAGIVLGGQVLHAAYRVVVLNIFERKGVNEVLKVNKGSVYKLKNEVL